VAAAAAAAAAQGSPPSNRRLAERRPEASQGSPPSNRRLAECVRRVANFSVVTPELKYDSRAFNGRKFMEVLPQASPKLVALLGKIAELDAADLAERGTLFKHCIYVDSKSSAHGAKLVAAAMYAAGYTPAYDRAMALDAVRLAPRTEAVVGRGTFALLCSSAIYGTAMKTRLRKGLLGVFNSRPDNVHGERIRFMIIDQGYREGIDLYDTKYCHLFEELETVANERQAIGRNTRYCGQKGLEFHPVLGWPLQVFRYSVDLPDGAADTWAARDLFDLYVQNAGLNLSQLKFAATLDPVVAFGAVDHDLTENVHEFRVENAIAEAAEAAQEALAQRAARGIKTLLGVLEGGARKARRRKLRAKNPNPKPPGTKKGFYDLRAYIAERFGKFTWPPAKMENLCAGPGAAAGPASPESGVRAPPPSGSASGAWAVSPAETAREAARELRALAEQGPAWIGAEPKGAGAGAAEKEGGAKKKPQAGAEVDFAQYSATQNFVRQYFQPASAYKGLLLHHSVGTGKCHAKDTAILMYDGTCKMVQDVVVGDKLMGDDSTPRTVLSLATGEDEMYDIVPIKGEKYTVNSEHILCLKPTRLYIGLEKNKGGSLHVANYVKTVDGKITRKGFKTREEALAFQDSMLSDKHICEITVKDYIALSNTSKKSLKGYRTGVDFNSSPVDFDPYIIGYWLGDGSKRGPVISSQDAAVLHYISREIPQYNLSLNYQSGYDYRVSAISNKYPNVFLKALQKYDLINNKHIPKEYKANSRQIRLQVLAGVIDSDGYASCQGYDIVQKNKTLADDIVFLCRSLGFAAYVKPCRKSCTYKGEKITGTYYRIYVSGEGLDKIPVKILRKIVEPRKQKKNALVTGITVAPIGRGTYYGFTLDGNNRYLLGDFTVTHNTCSGIAVASTSFEKQGYTILWVTRHTLKADIWKNMYKKSCSEDIKRRVRRGELRLPEGAVATPYERPMQYVSDQWLPPISFKQFTNMLQGKNDVYQALVKRNGAADPLRRTLVIIDEAHKLFDPSLPPLERPDVGVMREKIHKSYTDSGKDSVRLLLMTATPYTSDPMDFIRLLNLMREPSEAIPEAFAEFSEKYLDERGRFTERSLTGFLGEMSGYVSYLNREKDARTFAYPVFESVVVPMSRSDEPARLAAVARMEKQLARAKEGMASGKAAIARVRAKVREDKVTLTAQCSAAPTAAERAACKKKVAEDLVVFQERAIGDIQARIQAGKDAATETKARLRGAKKALKDKEGDFSQERVLVDKCGLPEPGGGPVPMSTGT